MNFEAVRRIAVRIAIRTSENAVPNTVPRNSMRLIETYQCHYILQRELDEEGVTSGTD